MGIFSHLRRWFSGKKQNAKNETRESVSPTVRETPEARFKRRYPELSNPTTPAERLATLLDQRLPPDDKIRMQEGIVAHPNIPPNVLALLLPIALSGFLRNPRAPQIVRESPYLWNAQQPQILRRLLIRADLPEFLVAPLTRHATPEIAQTASLHIAVAGEAGENWESEILALLSHLPPVSRDNLLELAEFGVLPEWAALRLMGQFDRKCRRTVLETNAVPPGHPLRRIAIQAAGSADLSEATDEYDVTLTAPELALLVNGGPFLRYLAARHPNTAPDDLARLTQDSNKMIRIVAARNPSTPTASLTDLIASGDEALTIAVARNAAIKEELYDTLSRSVFIRVRATLARHPRLSPELLTGLVSDPAEEVRQAALRHPRTPEWSQREVEQPHLAEESLRSAREPRVLLPATLNLLIRAYDPTTTTEELRSLLTKIPWGEPYRTAARLLTAIAVHPSATDAIHQLFLTEIRKAGPRYSPKHEYALALLRRPDLEAKYLAEIIRCGNLRILEQVLRHPSVTPEIFTSLAGHQMAEIRRLAVRKGGPQRTALLAVARKTAASFVRSYSPSHSLYAFLLWFCFWPPGTQVSSNQSDWMIRLIAVLRTKMTPEELRHYVENDGNQLVRAAARARLAEPEKSFLVHIAYPDQDDMTISN